MRYYKFNPEVDINNIFNQLIDFSSKFENEFNKKRNENHNLNKLNFHLDFIEFDKHYLVQAELAGITKENINIQVVEDNTLVISGKKEKLNDGKTVHRQERKYGEFQRRLILPDDSNLNSINAKFENGVLEIKIDKKEPEAPKVKEVSIS